MDYENRTPEEQNALKIESEKYNSYPVFLDENTLKDSNYYYDSVITPIFLNLISFKYNTDVRDLKLFQAYRNMNEEFMTIALSLYKKNPKSIIIFNDALLSFP